MFPKFYFEQQSQPAPILQCTHSKVPDLKLYDIISNLSFVSDAGDNSISSFQSLYIEAVHNITWLKITRQLDLLN